MKKVNNVVPTTEDRAFEETIIKFINTVPTFLEYENDGFIPIQAAVPVMGTGAIEHVPFLSQQAIEHGIFKYYERSGFLIKNENEGSNLLMRVSASHLLDDCKLLRTIKTLREANLLQREYIKEYDMLFYASRNCSQLVFEYITDWCPEGLRTHRICTYTNLPFLSHALISGYSYCQFFIHIFYISQY